MIHLKIRQKFFEFFKQKNHIVVASSSLISTDPSVLLTTAGMQQFKPYYVGEADPMLDFGSKNTASIQKCFRTSDIDEVGDDTHLTFFEMLGNFSFGGYFKEKAIEYAYLFLTKELELKIDKVTVFSSQKIKEDDWRKNVPEDIESLKIWESLGIEKSKIFKEGVDNFWGPTGLSGPCGPTTEIYIKNKNNQSVEIWNIVFNEYFCDQNKNLTKLKIAGVDTGMGMERLMMVCQNTKTIFETELFASLISVLDEDVPPQIKRIIIDHFKGSVFLISDGVRPSNKEAGYILRRILRRIITYQHIYKIKDDIFKILYDKLINIYNEVYPEIFKNKNLILDEIQKEKYKFEKTLQKGIKELNKINVLDGKTAFYLYETFGLPYEVIKELGGQKSKNLSHSDFEKEMEKHKEISREGQEKKFGGHGLILDTGELKAKDEGEMRKIIRLHTATHLLQQALREVLGPEIKQAGSDITADRTRFDFIFNRKLTPEELQMVEDLVNQKIKENLPVNFIKMKKVEAEKTGALQFFRQKYGEEVTIYYIGSSLKEAWSKEFCGGPHVLNTSEIGKFKILKEEGVGAGIRRIRATVLP